MPDTEKLKEAIETLRTTISEQEEALAKKKQFVNELCVDAGVAPIYTNTDLRTRADISAIRGDDFYGKGLSTAVRLYLERRKTANLGSATISEIHAALVKGGFHFEAKDAENEKRGLRISLTKNTAIFHRLPSGQYGLLDWYDKVKEPKPERAKKRGRRKLMRMRLTTSAKEAAITKPGAESLDARVIKAVNQSGDPLDIDGVVAAVARAGKEYARLPVSAALGRQVTKGKILRVAGKFSALPKNSNGSIEHEKLPSAAKPRLRKVGNGGEGRSATQPGP
jgi:hypothetical protein